MNHTANEYWRLFQKPTPKPTPPPKTMKREEVWQWRTLWIGKMIKTRYKCTEEFIRHRHPEAVRVEGTMEVRWIPEHSEEYSSTAPRWGNHPKRVQASADMQTDKFED